MELKSLLINAITTQPVKATWREMRPVISIAVRDESGTPILLHFDPAAAIKLAQRLSEITDGETA